MLITTTDEGFFLIIKWSLTFKYSNKSEVRSMYTTFPSNSDPVISIVTFEASVVVSI